MAVPSRRRLPWMMITNLVVRKDNQELRQALNRFIKKEYRGLFYNMRKERYFENPKTIARAEDEWRMDRSGRISPYDDLVKKYAP